MTTLAKHPCDSFFSEAATAFDSIARGEPPNCSQQIMNALITAGLIRRTVRVISRDSCGPILRYGYAVPADLRAQWCSSMEDDPFREDANAKANA